MSYQIFSAALWLTILCFLVPTATQGQPVDCTTLDRKLLCGYQGWFNAEGDGAERGFHHWTSKRGTLGPGNVKVDLWPDLSEFGPDEKFDTAFKLADGTTAQVFSSYQQATVKRHFSWMEQYGIHGVFVQRFSASLRDPKSLRHNNAVLTHCRDAATAHGRAYVVMYDLSGMKLGDMGRVTADWQHLRAGILQNCGGNYQHHKGGPLVAIWGIGFNDDRAYTLAECRNLVLNFKKDGCTVMLGVPTGWRTLDRDALKDPLLHEVIKMADVVSPWTVGRYQTPAQATRHGEKVMVPDVAWCKAEKKDYLPVQFPGFSWHNMYGRQFDQIPRLKGEFLWSQFLAAKKAGATMNYVAMFDEVDEGTAIFKCTNQVPVGEGVKFLTYEGLPSDHYLKLVGKAAELLRE